MPSQQVGAYIPQIITHFSIGSTALFEQFSNNCPKVIPIHILQFKNVAFARKSTSYFTVSRENLYEVSYDHNITMVCN